MFCSAVLNITCNGRLVHHAWWSGVLRHTHPVGEEAHIQGSCGTPAGPSSQVVREASKLTAERNRTLDMISTACIRMMMTLMGKQQVSTIHLPLPASAWPSLCLLMPARSVPLLSRFEGLYLQHPFEGTERYIAGCRPLFKAAACERHDNHTFSISLHKSSLLLLHKRRHSL